MGKIKRAASAAAPRARIASRAKSTEDQSNESFAPKRDAPRLGTENGAGQEKRSMLAADDGVLDEWLEPDEDEAEDLDQWLHEHGADGGSDDLSR